MAQHFALLTCHGTTCSIRNDRFDTGARGGGRVQAEVADQGGLVAENSRRREHELLSEARNPLKYLVPSGHTTYAGARKIASASQEIGEAT
jgi:hypothetical protein